MKTSKLVVELNNQEIRTVSGGYAPPTKEQMDRLREIYGPLADFICW